MIAAVTDEYDIAVIGGGPAGLCAGLWAARYRRRVIVLDAGEQRNRRAGNIHGYLGLDGTSPAEFHESARRDLSRYPESTVRDGVRVTDARREHERFLLALDDGTSVAALRLVLATGVRDIFPAITGFEEFFGSGVVTCPSCDGYEAQGRTVAVIGGDEVAAFSVGLLDWADSITVIAPRATPGHADLSALGIRVVIGEPTRLIGEAGRLQRVVLASGDDVVCQVAFCTMSHEQRSHLATALGCQLSSEGCVVVDDQCATSVRHVYAVGDMTPGPHLVQVAAAKGAVAGIAAATSLRGHSGSPTSPTPAPKAPAALAD